MTNSAETNPPKDGLMTYRDLGAWLNVASHVAANWLQKIDATRYKFDNDKRYYFTVDDCLSAANVARRTWLKRILTGTDVGRIPQGVYLKPTLTSECKVRDQWEVATIKLNCAEQIESLRKTQREKQNGKR